MSLLDVTPIIEQMLQVSEDISDLNFSVGQSPQVEINGSLVQLSPMGLGKLSSFQTETIAMALLRDHPEASTILVHSCSTDLSYSLPGRCRFRVNIFLKRGSSSMVMGVFQGRFPSFVG